MKTNNALLFKRLSSETDEILSENLDTLKDGGNSDGIDLEEVEIVGEAPAEDEEVEDPHDDEEPWDEWDEDGGLGTNPDATEEEEPVCCCELGLSEGNNGMIPELKDNNGLFSNLKGMLSTQKTYLQGLSQTQIDTIGAAGVYRQLSILEYMTASQ